MKVTWRLLMLAGISGTLMFTSCKKSTTDSDSNINENQKVTVHTDDQARFSDNMDAIVNDENTAIESTTAFSGRGTEITTTLCNANVTLDSSGGNRTLTIVYSGNQCVGTNRKIEGTVTLSIPLSQHFADQGAVVTATYSNLKITRVSDNKSMTFNGTHTLTNVSGGRIFQLASLGTIIHDLNSSGMQVTFDDGSTRSWMVSRRRTYTYDNGIVLTVTGTHTEGNTQNVSEWGTTRFGTPFVTAISQPLVIRQSCDFRLVSGQVSHTRMVADVVVTFGLNASGEPQISCPAGAFYYKVVWTGSNGNSYTAIAPY
jgi:hypothetical protein